MSTTHGTTGAIAHSSKLSKDRSIRHSSNACDMDYKATRGNMITIPVMNLKGGTGKTTVTRLLAPVLAEYCNVLMVDMDPHAGLTDSWIVGEPNYTSYDVLCGRKPISEAVIHLNGEDGSKHTLDLLGATGDLAQADRIADPGAAYQLRKALREIQPESTYQIVLVDATPSIGTIFSTALMAAHAILVVTEPNALGYMPTAKFVEMLKDLQVATGRKFPLAGVLLNRVKGTKENQEYSLRLKELLGEEAIFPYVVRDRTIIQQSAKANELRKDRYIEVTFQEIATDLLERLGQLHQNHEMGEG